MALYLARVCDADVTGITLSEGQFALARTRAEAAGLADRVRFRLEDYRQTEGQFDAIVSVGMFEHVGLRQYGDFFAATQRLLAPDGVMLLHTIAQPQPSRAAHPFIAKYIFPGGLVPALSQVLPEIERSRLLVRDIEILSLHYAETLKEWRRRFHAEREAVLALYDERFIRMWDLYLAGFEAAFRHDPLHVAHFQLVRDQERVPRTRAYLEKAMARLRAREATIPDYADLLDAPPARRSA
jgi:cyclopropane-fatty-acyl-phospholipid synthase